MYSHPTFDFSFFVFNPGDLCYLGIKIKIK